MAIFKIYTTQVRSLLEYGAVSWHSMLTIENEKAIERVQKSAIAIILGAEYENYEQEASQIYHCKGLTSAERNSVLPLPEKQQTTHCTATGSRRMIYLSK